jgi:signal transduction histidine kinase
MEPPEPVAADREAKTEPRTELIEFAAAASHDLSTPLQLISGYADMLASRLEPRDPEAQTAMDGILRAVERMKSLVDGLLGYARLGDEMAAEPVDSGKVVRDTMLAMQAEIEACGAEVEVVGELPVVSAIPGQLHQLFQNLISNALKFRSSDAPRVVIACASEPGIWHFTVADNGIGIEPHEMTWIFDIFKRSRAVPDRPGSGIGLAVAKGVVERHGGRIWVEPANGEGSIFHFTIPVAHRRAEDPPTADPPDA